MKDARRRIHGAIDGLGLLPASEGRDLLVALAEYTLRRRR